jgi:catalase (peroxidase I)
MSKHFPTGCRVKISLRTDPNYEEISSSYSKHFEALNTSVEGGKSWIMK